LRIGIFGGTFDPPHVGHLILAMEAGDQLSLDRVLWVLTPEPPHKLDQPISLITQRLEMVATLIKGDPKFELSRVDIDRPGPYYALDTVRLLSKQFPQDTCYYLIGGDSLHDLPTWHLPEEFVATCDGLGVLRRPHDAVDMDEVEKAIPGITRKVHFLSSPQIEISAADIRSRIKKGRPFQYFLTPLVYEIISQRGYYL
jgi:nicotinate-nucleotide adenylyltransferase